MFVKLTRRECDESFEFLCNMSRVQYIDPLVDGGCRLYFNVAGSSGNPYTLDIEDSYEEVAKLVKE